MEKISDGQNAWRKPTNVSSLYTCVGLAVVLFISVGYCFIIGDTARLFNGYDDCGNVCGKDNSDNKITRCGSNDKRNQKFLLEVNLEAIKTNSDTMGDTNYRVEIYGDDQKEIKEIKKCVESCEKIHEKLKSVGNRCVWSNNSLENTDLDSLLRDLGRSWLSILLVCFVALTFSYILLVLFRKVAEYMIWGVLVANVLILVVFAALIHPLFIICAIISAVYIYFRRKNIRMVGQIFREASKAIANVPLLVAEPVLTFISMVLSFFIFIYFWIIIESAGSLTEETDELLGNVTADYKPTIITSIINVFNVIAFVWFIQFIIGCQHFVIASTISDWYVAQTKSKLDSPIKRAFSNLINFHLGSICLGSMLVTLVAIVRFIVSSLLKYLERSNRPIMRIVGQLIVPVVQYIMRMLEDLFKYFVRNAYIIVAKDGTPFLESGKRAYNLITTNLGGVIDIVIMGDRVLMFAKLFIVLICAFVGVSLIILDDDIIMKNEVFVVSVILVCLIVHCFMTVFKMTLETIFICFCDDLEVNDGVTRPYHMSQELMDVMQELKRAAGGEFHIGGKENVEAGALYPELYKN